VTASGKNLGLSQSNGFRVISPAPREAWREIIDSDPQALVTHSPEWLDSLCATNAYEDASRYYQIPGRGEFILPLVRTRNRPSILSELTAYPEGWGFGGVLGTVPPGSEDIGIILEDLLSLSMMRLIIRPNPLSSRTWARVNQEKLQKDPRLAHVLDLRGGFSEVWSKRFSSTTRRYIRKAEKSGVEVQCDRDGELVSVYYQLFRKSVKRWAAIQHEPLWLANLRAIRRDPVHKFDIISKFLGSACRLWVAWYQHEPAAAIIVLQGANAHYTRGVMDKELAGPSHANDLLHSLAIEDACNAGCRYYHMGETGLSKSLAIFKKRFGAEEYPYYEYRYERLPITKIDQSGRAIVKKVIGFRDAH
jgi:hypothetical protein